MEMDEALRRGLAGLSPQGARLLAMARSLSGGEEAAPHDGPPAASGGGQDPSRAGLAALATALSRTRARVTETLALLDEEPG